MTSVFVYTVEPQFYNVTGAANYFVKQKTGTLKPMGNLGGIQIRSLIREMCETWLTKIKAQLYKKKQEAC